MRSKGDFVFHIKKYLEWLDFVQWDRYVDEYLLNGVLVFYGWIDRQQDSYKDFLVLEFKNIEGTKEPEITFTTSSVRYTDKIAEILEVEKEKHDSCRRVEALALGLTNVIKLTNGVDLNAYVAHNRKMPTKQLKLKLMAEDPHCHWCGMEVKLYKLANGQQSPEDLATIDHLYDRFDPENRYKVYPNHEDKVLSCYKCNVARSLARQRSLGKQQILARMSKGVARKEKGDLRPRAVVFGDVK